MLDEAHEHAAREVLVALDDVDVGRRHPGHRVEVRRHRREARSRVERGVVDRGAVTMFRTLRHAEHVDPLLAQVARTFGGHQDERRSAVVLEAAVEEPERLDDPARRVVHLGRQRPPVHHRTWIRLRVLIRRERDRAQRLAPEFVVVQEAHGAHRVALARRDHAIRKRVRLLAGDGGRRPAETEARELPLRERAEDDDAVRHARRDRRRRVADRRRAAAPAPAPLHVGEAQLVDAERRGEPRRVVAIVRVGREAVDVARRYSRVLARAEDRLERERELGLGGLSMFVVGGLADARDRDTSAQRSHAGSSTTPPPTTESSPSWLRASCAISTR